MLRRLRRAGRKHSDDPQIRELGWEAGATAATEIRSLKPRWALRTQPRTLSKVECSKQFRAWVAEGRGAKAAQDPRPHDHPAQRSQTWTPGLRAWGGARHKGQGPPLQIGEPGGTGAVGPVIVRRLCNPEVLLPAAHLFFFPLATPQGLCDLSSPDPGLNVCPLRWKHTGVPTTGPGGNSQPASLKHLQTHVHLALC